MTRMHILNPVAEVVRESLMAGQTSAIAVKHSTGLSMESVYAALIWLEARGLAFLTCAQKDHNSKYVARWETQ